MCVQERAKKLREQGYTNVRSDHLLSADRFRKKPKPLTEDDKEFLKYCGFDLNSSSKEDGGFAKRL
jgi:hypothetical protein